MSDKIRRMVLLEFKEEAPREEIETLLTNFRQGLAELEGRGVRNIMLGPLTRSLGTFADEINVFSHIVSMDFDDEVALKGYQEGDLHRELRERFIHLIGRSQSIEVRDPQPRTAA